jgi:two-component system chemotaxis response regulator CheY
MPRARVLVVESEESTRQLVGQTLTREGYEVVEADNVETGMKALRHSKGQAAIDVVLCNRHLVSKNGHDAIVQFLGHRPAIPVVMLADHADLQYATQMFRQGVVDYLVKPVQCNALIDVIRHAVKVSQE